jgi:hypothetical protein
MQIKADSSIKTRPAIWAPRNVSWNDRKSVSNLAGWKPPTIMSQELPNWLSVVEYAPLSGESSGLTYKVDIAYHILANLLSLKQITYP